MAFPGLGLGKECCGIRKLSNQLVMGGFFLLLFLSSFLTVLVCFSCSFQNDKHVYVAV